MAIDAAVPVLRSRRGFGARIVVAFVFVLLLTQLATLSIVDVAVDRNVHRQLGERLEVGERVWDDVSLSRAARIEESVAVLADDFAFREALATGDAPTVLSALVNHSQRIGADVALLLDNEGKLRSASPALPATEVEAVLAPLLARAQREGRAASVVVLGGRMYQVALVPVLAPRLTGWVAMGQRFDDVAARQFKAVTGLDAAFFVRVPALDVQAATLPLAEMRTLLGESRAQAGDYLREFGANGSPGDRVRVALLADAAAAMLPYQQMKRRILLLAAAATMLVFVFAVLLGRRVSRPVERLAVAARRIGGGDYGQPLPVKGNDEFTDLAYAFNRMQGDIAEREARISHQASHDGLTDLPNRGLALQELERTIARTRDAGGSSAILMFDLDRFKEINDTLGHAFGDGVLEAVAARLRNSVRERDLLARLGGDEFLVILEGADSTFASRRAQAFAESLDAPFALQGAQVNLDASIGIAVYPSDAGDAASLLRRADIAMYEAKQTRARIALYQPGHDERHLRQIGLMAALRQAVERGELHVAYQPKIDLATGGVAHVEALLRWLHPEFGSVPPDEFIPLAERSGVIYELTRFVLDESLRCASRWIREGRIQGVAVNLSPLELANQDLPVYIEDCLQRHGFDPTRLVLEVTESTVMRDIIASLATMHRLRDLGMRLSIDDFGTGHSSLAQLRSLPVQEIKIDKSFITALGQEGADSVIVRSAIEIGHNMGLSVIAEGVEDPGCLQVLRELRCDMVQGYLFTPPLAAEQFVAWHDRYEHAA